MDDSDLDFTDLCSRLLKRKVRKKAGEQHERGGEAQPKGNVAAPSFSKQTKKSSSQAKKRAKKDVSSERVVEKTTTEPPSVLQAISVAQLTENGTETQTEAQPSSTQLSKVSAKEKVLSRMQRFKRVDPQKLHHGANVPTTSKEPECGPPPSSDPVQNKELSLDARLALRLQQELDREYELEAQARAAQAAQRVADTGAMVVDVDQGGLFFCQLCFRDLSAMTPQSRTQHINRCLDQNESQAAPAPSRPSVPECPICGKKGFKSQKSRSAHLKKCSVDMGVPPGVLLQALQRQASEATSDTTAAQSNQPSGGGGGPKRRSPSDPGQPARKKAKRKPVPLDEDTMVALALSRSLLDQGAVDTAEDRATDAVRVSEVKAEPQTSVGSKLQWIPAVAGKGKRKKRRGVAATGPPPLLLRQDPAEALQRLQERVSLLLLRSRTPTPPPTPTLAPSALSRHGRKEEVEVEEQQEGGGDGPRRVSPAAAPLWHQTALPAGYDHNANEFYTPELSTYIQPYVSPQSDLPPATATTSTTPHEMRSQAAPSSSQQLPSSAAPPQPQLCSHSPTPTPSAAAAAAAAGAAGTPTLLLPSQAVQDLLELGEKGLILAAEPPHGTSHAVSPGQKTRGCTDPDSDSHDNPNSTSSLSRLSSDLGSMVNNPQLSDVQLQVDSGEVFFVHSFMLYARCPLLAEQVHANGFGVSEEGMPAAQRVLLGEVPAQAVLLLLRFLYTARCPLTPSLAPHVHELANRFDVPELTQQCELYLGELKREAGGAAWVDDAPAQEPAEGPEERDDTHAHQHFLELLRSMWSSEEEEEDGDEERQRGGGGRIEGMERSIRMQGAGKEGEENGGEEEEEERVDEEELDEIYEFAATQRRGGESALVRHGAESLEEEEDEEEEEEIMKGSDEEGRVFLGVEDEKSSEGGVVCEKEGGVVPIGEPAQETTPTTVSECLPSSQIPGSSSSRHKDSLSHAETRGCTPEDNKMEAEEHPEPAPHADGDMDDSFNHLFSQSWGEYAEPSPAPSPTPRSRVPSRPDSVVGVIDLSVSPTPPHPCDTSLPVAGLSPEVTVSRGSQRRRLSSAETTTHTSQRFRASPERNSSSGSQKHRPKFPDLTLSQRSQSHRVSAESKGQKQSLSLSADLPNTRHTQRAGLSLKLRTSQDARDETLSSNSRRHPSIGSQSQSSREVELIVLSDSSNESPTCLSPSSPPPTAPPLPTSPPSPAIPTMSRLVPLVQKDSPGYTAIKDWVPPSQDRLSSSRSTQPNSKHPSDGQPTALDATETALASPVPHGSVELVRVEDPPRDLSVLDGSAELSWLVPSTPFISNNSRSRSSSTQAESGMRRTRLFQATSQSSSSSSSSQSSSSSSAKHHKASSASNVMTCKEEPEEEDKLSGQSLNTSPSTLGKLQGTRHSIAGDESPVFIPPTGLPRRLSSAVDVTPREALRGFSVDSLSSKSFFPQPQVSSTPLHSEPESLMGSPLLSAAAASFSSRQAEKNRRHRGRDVGTAPRLASSSERNDDSPEISHPLDVSSSSPQKGANVKDSRQRSNSGSSERTEEASQSEKSPSTIGKEDLNEGEENRDTKMNDSEQTETTSDRGLGVEDKHELSLEHSFGNYDDPPMPFDEPPMAYDDPPMAFDEYPVTHDDPSTVSDEHPITDHDPPDACDEPPMGFDERSAAYNSDDAPDAYDEPPPMAFDDHPAVHDDYDEPPMAFDDSWGLGVDCNRNCSMLNPRFSLRLESSGDASLGLNQPSTQTALPSSQIPQAQGQFPGPDGTPPPPAGYPEPQPSTSALDPKLWDSWAEDDDEEEALPLSQRMTGVAPAKRVAQLRTPVASKKKAGPLVPITPMPHYSDMDTPDLKNRLNRFGVRALPKRQMVMKLKEIYQYTHQLETSEEEEEGAAGHGHRPRPASSPPPAPGRSCAQSLSFKEPRAPPAVSPRKLQLSQDNEQEQEPLSLSQSSTTSSTSERSNPELAMSDSSSDSDDCSITASQALSRETDKLEATRRFILSDPELYSQVLQYKPLVLSDLHQRLKDAGIRLGAAKLLDFLDTQCITFTTAKPGQKAPSRKRRKKKVVAAAGAEGGGGGRGRWKGTRKRGGAVQGAS